MAKKSFIKTLLERRIPQILGSYLVAGTSLILFIEYLIDKYQFPSHYATLALFALIGILPSVMILSYFHGTPGKDEWTKVEKVGIPINVLFIAGILFFGDSLNIWEMSNSSTNEKLPKVHLLYIGSPKNDHGSCYEYAENTLSENKDSELFSLNKEELHSLRENIESRLYSEFYNHNLEIRVIKDNEEIDYIDNTINEDNNDKITAKKVYDFFNKPAHIVFTWVYSINSNQGKTLEYVADTFGGLGDGFGYIMRSGKTRDTIKEIEEGIFNLLVHHITAKENLSAKGKVLKVDGDYIYINTGGLKLIENMNLIGYTKWSHYDKDDDGFTDRDSSYYKWLNDIKRALEYVKNSNNYSSEDINFFQKKYNWLISDSLRSTAQGERWPGQFGYNLKVVSIKDSVAIAKLIEKAHPWVEVNIGDGVMLAY